jgi:hypothetical protein
MAGQIKRMIDNIIVQRSKGSKVLEGVVKMKLILKGIDPKHYTESSPDDFAVMARLQEITYELELNSSPGGQI